MEPWLPSLREGVLTVPAIRGHGQLELSERHVDGGNIGFMLRLSHHLDRAQLDFRRYSWVWVDMDHDIVTLWVRAATEITKGGELPEASTIEGDLRFQLSHDGFGHYTLTVIVSHTCPRTIVVECPVMLEAGQIDRLAAMWATFFSLANEPLP
jgi:hypothetical protein